MTTSPCEAGRGRTHPKGAPGEGRDLHHVHLGAVALMLAFTLSACPVAQLPGDQPMGLYAMTANQGVMGECGLAEFTNAGAPDLSFQATLTRESTSARAWLTLAGYSREGTFDGQLFSSVGEAERIFAACSDCRTRLVERFAVAVLSRSQSDSFGGVCPEHPLDGGVPPAMGSVTLPRQTEQGFDAVRLCGELATELVADGRPDGGPCDAVCSGCPVRYELRGDRR